MQNHALDNLNSLVSNIIASNLVTCRKCRYWFESFCASWNYPKSGSCDTNGVEIMQSTRHLLEAVDVSRSEANNPHYSYMSNLNCNVSSILLNPNQLRALRGAALTFFTIGNFHGWLGCDAALLLALLFEEENPTKFRIFQKILRI